jgi:hypothetical protein
VSNKTLSVVFSLSLLGGVVACPKESKPKEGNTKIDTKDGGAKTDTTPKADKTPKGPKMPAANGAEVLEYFMKTSPYTSWNLLPIAKYPNTIRTEYLREGSHRFFNGKIAKTYYNDIGTKALNAGEATMPVGTMIVVPRWNPAPDGSIAPEDKPDDIVVMYRVKDYDAANGDWFYMAYAGDKIAAEGKVEKCQTCHLAVKDKDFRFTDSGLMTTIAPAKPPEIKDKGLDFVKNVTSGYHYTHYDVLPDEKMGKVIPRTNDFSNAIEWFNPIYVARVFVNKIALDSINAGDKVAPEGAIYIAEQYKRDKDNKAEAKPFAIVAQVKVKGYNAKVGDWYYLAYSFDDQKIIASGTGTDKDKTFCSKCHDQVKDNDFIFSTSGKRPPAKK